MISLAINSHPASFVASLDAPAPSEPTPGVAPTLTASDALTGRDLSILISGVSGTPMPSVALTALSLDGLDVLAEATGTGPWTYTVPSSADAQDIAWTVTATNTEGTDTASGSETIAGDQAAPTITATDSLVGRELSISVTDLTGTPVPEVTLSSLTLDGTDMRAEATSTGPWTYTVPSSTDAQDIAWTVTATNTQGTDTASGSETIAGDQAAPTITATDSLVGRELSISITDLTGTPVPEVTLSSLTLDGTDMRAEATGTGPWAYTVPSSADAQDIAWTVTATNTQGTDTASGSETIAGDQAPQLPTVSADGSVNDVTPEVGETIIITPGVVQPGAGGAVSYVARFRIFRAAGTVQDITTEYVVQPEDAGARIIAEWRGSETDNGAVAWQIVLDTTVASASVGEAPTVIASGEVIDSMLSVSVMELSGAPAPDVALTELSLDGMDVMAEATGTGPWTYAVPAAATTQDIAWTVTATNSEGTDTNSGATTIAGDQAAPTITATDSLVGRELRISVTDLTGTPVPDVALSTLTLDGIDMRAEATGTGPWTYTAPSSADAQGVAWAVTATNAQGTDTASGFTTIAGDQADPAPQPGALSFGALTPVGQGALPMPGLADGTYGPFTATAEQLTTNTSPLTPGIYNVDSQEIVVTANALHVSTVEELNTVRGRADLGGQDITVYLRPGRYLNNGYDSRFDANQTPITFAADDPDQPPVLERWVTHPRTFTGSVATNAQGYSYVLDGLTFDFTEELGKNLVNRRYQDLAPGSAIIQMRTAQDALVRNCDVTGNLPVSSDGGRPFSTVTGIDTSTTATRVRIEGCTVHNVESCYGMQCDGGQLVNCEGRDFHGDFISSNGQFRNGLVANNHCSSPGSNPTFRHPDWFQVNAGHGPLTNITAYGNTVTWGNVGRASYDKTDPQAPRGRVVYTNETDYLAANDHAREIVNGTVTLTPADTFTDLQFLVAPGTTATVVLPQCAASDGYGYFCQIVGNRAGATLEFALAPGDTHEAGTLPPLSGNQQGYSFVSSGGTQWAYQELGYLQFNIVARRSMVLDDTITRGQLVMVSTADAPGPAGSFSANRQITLPAGYPGAVQSVQRIYPDEGTVTLQTTGGEQIVFDDGTPTGTSVSYAEGQGYKFVWDGAQWLAYRGALSLQGYFSNEGSVNCTFYGNIFMGQAANTFWPELAMVDTSAYNNTFLSFPVDGHPKSPSTAKMRLNGATAAGQHNFVLSSLTRNDGAQDVGTLVDGLASGGDMSPLLPLFGANTLDDFRPDTREDVFAAARAAAGSVLDVEGIGAVGPTDTNGFFNPSTGAPNASFGAPKITETLPRQGDPFPANGEITLSFDQFIEKGAGNVQVYNVTDGTVAQTVPITDAQFWVTGSVLHFLPATPLPIGKTVELRIGSGVVMPRFYVASFAGLSAGEYRWQTTAIGQSDYQTVTSTGAYLTGGALAGDKPAITKALIALQLDQGSGSSGRYDLFGVMDGSSPRVRAEMIGSTFAFTGWGNTIRFRLTSPIPTNGITPERLLISIDTTAPDMASGVTAYLGNTPLTPENPTWASGASFSLSQVDNLELLALSAAGRYFQGVLDFAYIGFPSSLPDISQASVRDSFQYLNMGPDGSGPTGEVPEIFLTGLDSWNAGTNLGGGGNLTPNGTFTIT